PLAAAEKSGTPLVPSGIALANAAGCGNNATAACLRGVSAETLVGIEPGIVYPFIDGKILDRTLTQAFTSGKFNQVPVIAGTNHDEWRAFVPQDLTDAEYPAAVAAMVGMSVDSLVVQALLNNDYPLSNYPPPPGVMSAPLALGALGT